MIKFIMVLVTGFIINASVAQTVQESIPNAQILEIENGFVITGIKDNQIQVKLFDNKLIIQKEISIPISSKDLYVLKLELIDNNFLVETIFSRILFNANIEVIQKSEWTQNDCEKLTLPIYGYDKLNNYVPYNFIPNGKNKILNRGDYILEVLNKKISGYKKYKGSTKIRRLERNSFNTPVLNYSKNWETELNHDKINTYKWYDFKSNQLYLYIRDWENPLGQDYLYKINETSGNIECKFNIKFNDEYSFAFSNILIDQYDNVIVYGNYDNNKSKNVNNSINNMIGWYCMKFDSIGNLISEKYTPFENHTLLDIKGKPLKGKIKYSHIRSAIIDSLGNFHFISEHIRKYWPDNSSGMNWQTYGFSYYIIDEAFNSIDSSFINQLYIDKNHKKGRGNMLVSPMYNEYDIINEHVPYTYNNTLYSVIDYSLVDSYTSNDGSSSIIYRRKENLNQHYSYYYKTFTGGNKEKIISLGSFEERSLVKFYINNENSVISFLPTKDSFILNFIQM